MNSKCATSLALTTLLLPGFLFIVNVSIIVVVVVVLDLKLIFFRTIERSSKSIFENRKVPFDPSQLTRQDALFSSVLNGFILAITDDDVTLLLFDVKFLLVFLFSREDFQTVL